MHEWALAEGVVDSAIELSEREGMRKVTRIHLRVGELQRISTDVFRQAVEAVTPPDDPRLAGVELVLEVERAGFDCRRCGRSFDLGDAVGDLDDGDREAIHFVPELAHSLLRCPGCDGPDFAVTRGRGLWLDRIEGEG